MLGSAIQRARAKLLQSRRANRGLHQRLELARLVQLANDVAAADELAVDINLRNRRPVAVALDSLAQLRVAQHVGSRVGHAQLIENRDGGCRKSALRKA